MSGESQQVPDSEPDPTVIATEQMLRAIENLEKQSDLAREGDLRLIEEKIAGLRREDELREAHRLERKADDEKALTAALASAEAARIQQAKTSQEAIAKTEAAFTLGLDTLNKGLDEVKQSVTKSTASDEATRRLNANLMALAAVFLIALGIAVSVILAGNS